MVITFCCTIMDLLHRLFFLHINSLALPPSFPSSLPSRNDCSLAGSRRRTSHLLLHAACAWLPYPPVSWLSPAGAHAVRPATEAEEEIKKKQNLVREKIAAQVNTRARACVRAHTRHTRHTRTQQHAMDGPGRERIRERVCGECCDRAGTCACTRVRVSDRTRAAGGLRPYVRVLAYLALCARAVSAEKHALCVCVCAWSCGGSEYVNINLDINMYVCMHACIYCVCMCVRAWSCRGIE